MRSNNLLVIANNFPNEDNSYVAGIFVKEQIKYLKNYFQTVYVISPVPYGMESLRKTTYRDYQYENVKVFFPKYFNVLFFYTRLRSIWVYFEIKAMLEVIEREGIDFDLIHAHFTWPSGAVAIELKTFFNVPVAITSHSNITFYKELKRKNSNYISIWKKSDAIIRVSKKDIPLFINSGVNSNKIYHIVNGYDPTKYFSIAKEKARELLNLPQGIEIILNISRLYRIKGQDYLVKAMAEVIKNRSNCRCYIGGNGPERDKLKDQISELGLQDYVHLIGFVPDDKMCLWINACDIFVLPSLNETNPTVMFECLGCGKPFVGTKVGGVPEIITSDDYGLLAEPGDTQDLAEKIKIALDKSWDERQILKYVEQYKWENIAAQIATVYDEICSENLTFKSA
ncbi:glycosyltransferase [Methanosarcina mazei]|uniref:Glycosyl transferase family 1 n=1 Tax=Methanosarcina mazei TaxID=2209 RepID=A0A0F8I219_METMZ|nr:glycosyltransferase [Methanosarcina mazei]KKG83987.1 hypothetical protein DU55_04620 [Methanosarcina mazei]